jgi:hypothetical protein
VFRKRHDAGAWAVCDIYLPDDFTPIIAIAKIGAQWNTPEGNPKKRKHKTIQDWKIRKGDSVGHLALGWELDLGIRGEIKASNQAEAVFRENPKIKQILYYLRLGSRTWAAVKHIPQKRFRPVRTSHFSFKYNAPYESTSPKLLWTYDEDSRISCGQSFLTLLLFSFTRRE